MFYNPIYVLLVERHPWKTSTSPAMLGEWVFELDRTGLAMCAYCAYVDPSRCGALFCPLCDSRMVPIPPVAVMPARWMLAGFRGWPAPLSEEETAVFLDGYGRAAGRA